MFKPNPPITTDSVQQTMELARRVAQCSQSKARALVSEQLAVRLKLLPLTLIQNPQKQMLFVACPQDLQFAATRALRFSCNAEIRCVHQAQELLERAIPLAYALDGAKLLGSAKRLEVSRVATVDVPKAMGEPAQFVQQLLEFAMAQQASDIHLDPRPEGVCVRFRIAGELCEHGSALFPLAAYAPICARIKVLARLDTTLRAQPQDGALEAHAFGQVRAVRVSTLPTIHGEKLVLRLMRTDESLGLKNLGYDAHVLQIVRRVLLARRGMLLVSGPTGSGKTTTLYGCLQELRTRALNIVSIEDPVERQVSGVNQVMVNTSGGLSMGASLRSVLRQDPDVIMVGEIRDEESAKLAVQAALTGHLVLTSIHAGSLEQARRRFEQLGVSSGDLGLALQLLLFQELECAEPSNPDEATLDSSATARTMVLRYRIWSPSHPEALPALDRS